MEYIKQQNGGKETHVDSFNENVKFNGQQLCKFILNIIKLKSLFVCWLNVLISGTTSSNWKNVFVLDSPFIEAGYWLFNITLRPIEDSQRMKLREQLVVKYNSQQLCKY